MATQPYVRTLTVEDGMDHWEHGDREALVRDENRRVLREIAAYANFHNMRVVGTPSPYRYEGLKDGRHVYRFEATLKTGD